MKWCLEWKGTHSQKGYGLIQIGGKNYRVHRLVYQIFYGPIPHRKCVLHRCDNPPCFRPEHLWLGTPQENSSDMVQKSRSAKGEHHSQSKLTSKEVSEIRRRYSEGVSQQTLANQFRVDQSNIHYIVSQKTWKGQ